MVQRRTRRIAAALPEEVREVPKAPQVRRVRQAKETAPLAEPAARRDPSSSPRVDYDAIILRYKERANTPKKAIRAMCIECMGGMIAEVDRCSSADCALYPFRKGENPFHKLSKHNRAEESEE